MRAIVSSKRGELSPPKDHPSLLPATQQGFLPKLTQENYSLHADEESLQVKVRPNGLKEAWTKMGLAEIPEKQVSGLVG